MKKEARRNLIPPPGVSAPTPAPTPQTTSAGLLVGVYALVKLDSFAFLHLFNCEVRITQRLVEVTGHGDEWEQWVPLRQGWTARARGYLDRAAAVSATYIGKGANKTAPGPEMTLTLYSDYGTTPIFTGLCFSEEITLQRSQAMVEQEISLRGSVAPSVGPA